ncbi:uncharacterized protein [Ptychodera flava]|uniref:uncharacterized protein n=1 Tax=Ptychodera flava TaxID=63121 RepID=UPI00396A405B
MANIAEKMFRLWPSTFCRHSGKSVLYYVKSHHSIARQQCFTAMFNSMSCNRPRSVKPFSWARVNYFRLKSGQPGSNVPEEDVSLPDEIEEILQSAEVQKDDELKKLVKEIASDFRDEDSESVSESEPEKAVNNLSVTEKEASWTLESIAKDDKTIGGVFKIDELVEVLKEENAKDICVIKVPKEKQYVDYFVIVSCRSTRHMQAMTQYIIQLFKQKRRSADPFVRLEGKHTEDWMCIDFGEIVVHFFLPATREAYELEKLWTLGAKYDDQLRHLAEQAAMLDLDIEAYTTEDNEDISR